MAEGLDMFRLGAVATGEGWTRQATYPLRKELGLNGCLVIEPRKDGITLAEGLATIVQ
jgi:hypothetical protein